MKMNKMFAGLIAFVAGVALSAGSAAADGYMTGDPAMMKLIPYYETGDTKATIIGIQNMSEQEEKTKNLNAAVKKAQTDLKDENAKPAPDPTDVANFEKALAKAEKATYTEHLFIVVNAYDDMGMMTESATLCLAENQFGHVVLQGPADMRVDGNMAAVLSVMDGDIESSGYVKVMAENRKFTGCGATAPNTLKNVLTGKGEDTKDPAKSMVATWAIIQDTGMGFFGTEVSTATISMIADDPATDTDETAPNCYKDGKVFSGTRCGLIPERIEKADKDPIRGTDGKLNSDFSPNATAYARYDAGDDSMVYVWLAAGMDKDTTLPKNRRMLDVAVICEDGMMPAGPDTDGDNQPDGIKVAAPTMLTMIDPIGAELGDYTDMCEGDRGVLKITMPDGSHAGMVFTHITQMMGHYRMNFQGYSMAPPSK